MSRVLAYDLCRLFIGPSFATPRGIDRVDLAMANHLFADPDSPHVAILPTPLGVRVYPARVARLLLTHLRHLWRESLRWEDDVPLRKLVADMRAPRAPEPMSPPRAGSLTRAQAVRGSLSMLRHTGVRLGQDAARGVPEGAVYLNLGQLGLAMPSFFDWLARRPDVACALMIHDTIPLDHPELVKSASVAHHGQMVCTAAAHADGLIFSTDHVRASVRRVLAQVGEREIHSLVRSLPVPMAFAEAGGCHPELDGLHYFVVVSTIEPRKNFGLLIRLWERLVANKGAEAPHLVIVGAPGLDAQHILAPLTHSPQLRARVHYVSGLSTPALARLMYGCAALLSPSLVEGFGLPLLEGIAMGVPTIASDIPSHREIAQGRGQLLDAQDEPAWERAILSTPRTSAAARPPVPMHMTEPAYCADLLAFATSLTPGARVAPARLRKRAA